MQREIKFRGFHKCENGNTIIIINGESVRGKWVYGYYFISERDIEDGFVWRDIPQIQQRYGDHYQYFDVIPETIGQYTGLKDSQGNELYEGDIIENEHKEKWLIVWNDIISGFGTALKGDKNAIYSPNKHWYEACRKIGNIHDNPELLEVGHGANI